MARNYNKDGNKNLENYDTKFQRTPEHVLGHDWLKLIKTMWNHVCGQNTNWNKMRVQNSEFRKFEETDKSIHQKNCYLYLMDRAVH